MTAETEQRDALIGEVAIALAKLVQPAIPISVDLWDLDHIARYLKRDPNTVRMRYACLPDFPKVIRLPSESGGSGRPLWKAAEVIAWAEAHRDGASIGRPRKQHLTT